jgi:ABC-2 type transport system permease protein
MRAFWIMLRYGLRQVLGWRRVTGLGLLMLVPVVVTWAVTRDAGDAAALRRFHEAPFVTLVLVALPVVALILGAAALGDERRDQTLSFLLVRPLRREAIVGAKLLSGWLAAALVVGGGAALCGLVMGLSSGRGEVLVPLLVATAISTLGYASVFVLLGYVTGRAVLYGLAYVFIWESGITGAVDSLATVSLWRIGLSAYVDLVPESRPQLRDVLGNLTPGVWGATAKVAVIAVVAVVLGGILLRHRDAT